MSLNTLVIEQAPAEVKLAFEVHQHSSLQSIRLVRAKLASNANPVESEASVAVGFDFRSKLVEARPGLLRIAVSFRMAGAAEGVAPPAVAVEALFEADYQLHEGYAPAEAAARAFKDGNAIFNVWPYFREFLQSSLQRMGLPPLTAPFLRLQPKAPKIARKDLSAPR